MNDQKGDGNLPLSLPSSRFGTLQLTKRADGATTMLHHQGYQKGDDPAGLSVTPDDEDSTSQDGGPDGDGSEVEPMAEISDIGIWNTSQNYCTNYNDRCSVTNGTNRVSGSGGMQRSGYRFDKTTVILTLLLLATIAISLIEDVYGGSILPEVLDNVWCDVHKLFKRWF